MFSDTLKEHNAAVTNWRKVERERAKKEAPKPPPRRPRCRSPPAPPPPAPRVLNAGPAAARHRSAAAVPLPVRKPKQVAPRADTVAGRRARRHALPCWPARVPLDFAPRWARPAPATRHRTAQ